MTPTQATIDFAPFANILLQAAGVVLMALASVAAAYIAQHFKHLNQDVVKAGFLDAADRAVSYATAKVGDAEAAGQLKVSVKSDTVAAAANYLLQGVPGAIKTLGIDQAGLERVVEAKMAQAAGVAVPPPAVALVAPVVGSAKPAIANGG